MLNQAEIGAAVAVLSGPILVHGAVTARFEERFAERIGSRRAIAVSSCTAALHLSLLARGIGPGDEVAVPALTHVATAHAAEFCGARPVFVDVEPDTGNMDADALADALSPAASAVIVVHFLGLPCDMDRIAAVARRKSAFVVEDCALALDARYGELKVGALGVAGCFSFYPIKHMTTIEGGMVTTDDDELADAVARRRAFGYDRTVAERARPGVYDVNLLGYNYRMNEVEAAIGLAQLDGLDAHQSARTHNYRTLKRCLDEVEEVTVFEPVKGKAVSSHYCLNAVLPRDASIDRDTVVGELQAAGIGTSVHYPGPLPLMTYYREKYGARRGQFPVAEWLSTQSISLPVGPHLREGDAERIGRAVADAVHKARRRSMRAGSSDA